MVWARQVAGHLPGESLLAPLGVVLTDGKGAGGSLSGADYGDGHLAYDSFGDVPCVGEMPIGAGLLLLHDLRAVWVVDHDADRSALRGNDLCDLPAAGADPRGEQC